MVASVVAVDESVSVGAAITVTPDTFASGTREPSPRNTATNGELLM